MASSIAFDITHLVSRLPVASPSGIDRIDLAYGRHFAQASELACGVHYGLMRPHFHSPQETSEIVALAGRFWHEQEDATDAAYAALRSWLGAAPGPKFVPLQKPRRSLAGSRLQRAYHETRLRIARGSGPAPMPGAIYLNVAQHAFEHALFFRWLAFRDDIRKVFFIHDLLSLDYPEYFRPGNLGIFERRLTTALRFGDAFLTSTESVRTRLREEIARRGLKDRPIYAGHFASPLELGAVLPDAAEAMAAQPYFVMLGTIEPRKNHLLILHLWRELVAADPAAPKLVVVGARGWEHEQVADLLDRCPELPSHVAEVSGLSSASLRHLLRHARALLIPSFGEGFGLPLIEALSLRTPVIASDIPVFKEIAKDHALFFSSLDGPGWLHAIRELADGRSQLQFEARNRAETYIAPTWKSYFSGIEDFLASLKL